MRNVKLFPIYYGTWTAAQINITNNFLAGLGGSGWWGINALYTDTVGSNSNTAGSMFNTGSTYYKYSSTTLGTALSDANVRGCG
jgi:hypothetical protein